MLMIGFFEDLPSERAIASRCADSLSVRGFLCERLAEATHDYNSLSVIRQRLSLDQLAGIHLVLLKALRQHGLPSSSSRAGRPFWRLSATYSVTIGTWQSLFSNHFGNQLHGTKQVPRLTVRHLQRRQ